MESQLALCLSLNTKYHIIWTLLKISRLLLSIKRTIWYSIIPNEDLLLSVIFMKNCATMYPMLGTWLNSFKFGASTSYWCVSISINLLYNIKAWLKSKARIRKVEYKNYKMKERRSLSRNDNGSNTGPMYAKYAA